MAINTRTLAQLVQGQAAAIQARAAGLVDLSEGSISLAIVEAFGQVVLWLQAIVLAVLALTRASTSTGSDLDSFVADFGAARSPDEPPAFARLGSKPSNGSATFSRFSTSTEAVVPFGSTVETADGALKFAVTVDVTNPAYNLPRGGYVLSVGVGSISVPIQAASAGSSGNVVAGAVNTITSAIPGVDRVSNALALENGRDAETDAQLRLRFLSWIQSLREGTPPAVSQAVQSLAPGVTCTVVENLNHDGTPNSGFFYLVVDDGSGSPPSSLLTAAALAVEEVRAITSSFAVYAPSVVTVAVAYTVVTVAGADHAAAVTASEAAVAAYIDTKAVGEGLSWSRLHQVAYDASPDITDITGLLVNGGTADLTTTVNQVLKAGVVAGV